MGGGITMGEGGRPKEPTREVEGDGQIPEQSPPFSVDQTQRPDRVVPSSLDVVESFFGQELDDSVIDAVEELPPGQTEELRHRIVDHSTNVRVALRRRTERAREFMKEHSGLLDELPGDYDHLQNEEIHFHEDLGNAGIDTEITNIGVLKHLALYCDRISLRDPLALYNDSPSSSPRYWLNGVADGLRQLMPIAEFVRAGHFVLGESYGKPTNPTNYAEHGFEGPDHYLLDLQILIAGVAPLKRESALLLDYIVKSGEQELVEPFFVELRFKSFTPITSNSVILRLLRQYTRELLDSDHQPDPSAASGQLSPINPAVQFGIPSLSEVSFAEIASLRKNEEVFAETRSALAELTEECAKSGRPESNQAYKTAVSENAEIVRPSFERVERLRRKAAGKKLATKLAVKGATFGIDGFVEPIIEAADMAGEPLIGRKAERERKDADVACKILKSILRY
jgi:hypothetical protein